jgi:hypothetical protein
MKRIALSDITPGEILLEEFLKTQPPGPESEIDTLYRKLIVMHDGELDRTTDATNRWGQAHIKLGTRTAAEIQSLDAGQLV